jgi:hypothetical protein
LSLNALIKRGVPFFKSSRLTATAVKDIVSK